MNSRWEFQSICICISVSQGAGVSRLGGWAAWPQHRHYTPTLDTGHRPHQCTQGNNEDKFHSVHQYIYYTCLGVIYWLCPHIPLFSHCALSQWLWLRVCCPRNTLLGVLWICVTRECLRDGIFLAILPLETLYSGQYHHFTSHDIRSKLFLVTCVWWEADWLNVYWIYCVWLFNIYPHSSLSHAHQRWSRCW